MTSVSFGLASTQGSLVVDHAQHRRAGRDETAGLDVVGLRGDAGNRRAQHGVIEIALRLVEHRVGLHEGRKLLDRQVGLAEQLVEDVRRAAARRIRLQLRRDQRGHRLSRSAASRPAAWPAWSCGHVALLELDVLLREIDQRSERVQIALELVEIDANGIELALRLATASGTARHRFRTARRRRRHAGLPVTAARVARPDTSGVTSTFCAPT